MKRNNYSSVIQIFVMFLFWRIFLFLVAFFSPKFIPVFGERFPYSGLLIESNLPHWLWTLGNFDGVHYLRIAQDGFAYQYTQTFFPFYPLLIKFFSIFTFGNLIISALIISNTAFLLALVIFYKLLAKIYSEKVAFWSCIFLLSFPTSFYFGSVYTESLFFLLVILAFYLYEKGNILGASIVGAVSSSTRLIGVFLAPSLVKNVKNRKYLIPLLIVPLGLLIYMIYLKIIFNNPFYFLTAQSIFGQERSTTQIILLPQVFWRYVKILATTSGLPLFNATLELSSSIFAIIFLILASKKVKKEWLIFSWLAIITPTLTGTLASMPRYILVAFPIYIVLAHIKSTLIKSTIVIFSLLILSVCLILFTQGYWVA